MLLPPPLEVVPVEVVAKARLAHAASECNVNRMETLEVTGGLRFLFDGIFHMLPSATGCMSEMRIPDVTHGRDLRG